MALAASGQLYSWGMGMDGRLGHGDIAHRDGPTLVAGLEDAGVALLSIAAGTSHSLAADAEGTLWTWGCGLEGALVYVARPLARCAGGGARSVGPVARVEVAQKLALR